MKISDLQVQGFRSYGEEEQQFDLDDRLTVLSAPNSQGKSSTLEALEFLLTGVLERREQFASALAEFKDSIRNAHIPDDVDTFVQAEIAKDDGTTHDVKRVLVSDYGTRSECQTQLFIDGNEADTLSEIGLEFEIGPLHLPILRQHTLRHTVSGPPTERADFLKSLLEVTDLDTVHTEIREALSELQSVEHKLTPLAAELEDVTVAVSDLPSNLGGLSQVSEKAVQRVLGPALTTTIEDLATEPELEVEEDFAAQTEQLRHLIRSRQDAVYPVSDLEFGEVSEAPEIDVPNQSSEEYNDAVEAIDLRLKMYREVYEALLKVDGVDEESAPLDCPVCETPGALSKERISTIREKLEESGEFQEAKSSLVGELESLMESLDEWHSIAGTGTPAAASWEDEKQKEYRESALDLTEEITEEDYSSVEKLLDTLTGKRDDVYDKLSQVVQSVKELKERVDNSQKVDLSGLQEKIASVEEEWGQFMASLGKYEEKVTPVHNKLKSAIRDEAGLRPHEIVAKLADSTSKLTEELAERKAIGKVSGEVEQALEVISSARIKVLDRNFEQLSDEIAKWWNHIRPGDFTAFRRVERRGTGLRFVDFKALLVGPDDDSDADNDGKIRNAAAVFSDSQLNALGVSTFLAKWTRDAVGFMVLDDPVLASDRAHVSTFSQNVVHELLDNTDLQVIIATYSHEFSERLQDLYQHRRPSLYYLSIPDPKSGTRATLVSDSVESHLELAEAYLGNQDPHMRRECATSIRRATERFCKELIVKNRRADGETCSVADYKGESLRVLVPEARKYLSEPDHPGKLKAIRKVVNPGPHDDTPPTVTSLTTSRGDLKHLKNYYL